MYKVFSLAVAVSVLPLSNKITEAGFVTSNPVEKEKYSFHFKNSFPSCLLETPKKPEASYTQNWMAEAQENIRKSEYHFKWDEKIKAWCSPNRKNNLRFYYNDKGFGVEPRTTKIPFGDFDHMARPDEIKYRTIPNWKIKFNLDKKQVGKGSWTVTENKAEYITDKITVQYLNNEEGMRQNFIVRSPLSKNNSLKINLTVQTKLKPVLKNGRLQFLHNKKSVLNYEDLKVWDAGGKALGAAIIKNKRNKYSINVHTTGAAYPITIDPISTTPAAMVESNQTGAELGCSVASAGDVNGDGYSDVIVGAFSYDNGQTNEGAAFVYHGSANGINITAAAMAESNQANARMGYSVSSAGDVNGDGYSDVIVGADQFSNGQAGEGAFYVYHGSALGISTTAAAMIESNLVNYFMGSSVASAGDVNGDGYSDIIVGVTGYSNGESFEGAAFVYHGSASGINTTVAAIVESNQIGAGMGNSVASAGDVNGDGYSDVIVGAKAYDNGQTDEGAAFVYHGSATGISTTPAAMVETNQATAYVYSVASAGDVNGDGYSDVIIGSPQYSNGQSMEGVAFVYHGSATGIITTPAAMVESNQVSAFLGISVACAGDVNGDGYSDLIAGAWAYDNGQADEGAAFVYLGSATGISTTAAAMMESNQAGGNLGVSVASAGDVNGDGYSDVIVGAQQYSNGEAFEGAAFVYHGSASGINITATAMVESNHANSFMGCSVASAGDVNGDGYIDVIVGADTYDNGLGNEGVAFIFNGSANGINTSPAAMVVSNQLGAGFGFSVASAGDINGDGYSDVIVGSYSYDDGQTNEGAAFIYHGSATGINTIAAATLESNQTGAFFGISVASAGDVNGDGYSDVIVGASLYDNGQADEGVAFVYLGSVAGINTAPASLLECNQPAADMGGAVASAGDVNGDGYSDVIVGAYGYNNGQVDEGAVFVYYGSATGINVATATIIESNQAGAYLGTAVACAGDVNGDGFSDIIAGAPFYDNGQVDEGVAFVYLGSASGIITTPSAVLECNQAGAFMGGSVASAGDINGDGYSDVIVGAYLYSNGQTYEGAAFLYQGSATGIIVSGVKIIESNLVNTFMGCSVSSAGDVNGDGYSDVIVGAYGYTNGQSNEGAFFIHEGDSAALNKRNNLRLYNTNLTTPINSSNFIFGNFGAGLFAKSFLGRCKGKLVWETRLNYNAWSGIPITNSTLYTTQQVSYADMGLVGIEFKNLITKLLGTSKFTKLRARIKYDPVTAFTGQVYSPWRYISSIIDANSLGVLPLEMISFNANWLQKGKTAQLDFKTDKESGICCFDIEKSEDGFNFYSIGSLPAKNVSGIQHYTFSDGNATGKNQYYRIKIKGIAGQTDYSNIQQLQNNTATDILVFPNPTTDDLHLQLNNFYNKMKVQIINSGGQMVKKLQLSQISQTISIPVQNLVAGKYWLILQSDNEKQVLQFFKQ